MKEHWYHKGTYEAEMSDLLGRVFTEVKQIGDELHMECAEGIFKFLHEQDCCESVCIESIVGDLNDLVGEPITLAETGCGETPANFQFEYEPESYTWTFYKFATRKGYVDVRWLGESNGYYSEEVELIFVKATDQ